MRMFYKNISTSAKTFYGVTFKPGDIKEVDGYINHRFMIPADAPISKESNVQQKPSSEKPKKDVKAEDAKASKEPEKVDAKASEPAEQKS